MSSGTLHSVSIGFPAPMFPGVLYQPSTGGTTSEATITPRIAPVIVKSRMVRVALICVNLLVWTACRRDSTPTLRQARRHRLEDRPPVPPRPERGERPEQPLVLPLGVLGGDGRCAPGDARTWRRRGGGRAA